MSATGRTLPLGVDIGGQRVRIALTAHGPDDTPKLLAVAAREHGGDPAGALIDALEELQTSERRCVLALGPPDALLCAVDLPPMTPWERRSAARFEAARFVDYPIGEAAVSLSRTRVTQRWTLGIVRRAALARALDAAKAARLRPVAVDHAAFALQRAHPTADGAIDVGSGATRLTLFGDSLPYALEWPIGGARLTDAIAQSLGLDVAAAEARKRQIGFGGAGEEPRAALLAALAQGFSDARAGGYRDVRNVVLCGNGSRVPGLGAEIARATGHDVQSATLPPSCSDTLPPDVLRAAAPDWSIAYGLTLWSIAT
jgi:type IV pilus assembly protein PilM